MVCASSGRPWRQMLQLMAHCAAWLGLQPAGGSTTPATGAGGGCPADFDGIACWPPTPPGGVATQACPHYLPDQGEVSRACADNATWESGASVNYTSCGLSEHEMRVLRRHVERATPTPPPVTSEHLLNAVMERYKDCLRRIKLHPRPPDDGVRYCNMTFDGYSCWDYAPAGSTVYAPCPAFVEGFDPTRQAFKVCLENGSWFRHPESGSEWSNYTTCVDMDDLQFRQVVNTLYEVGYSISFAALVVSLVIFFSFRSLKCTRIAIHVQLFLSFAANNLGWIVWYRRVVGDPAVVSENSVACQALHVALQYLMLANYLWMFCEGLHLHLALVVVFVKDESAMRWFLLVGWGLPLPIAALYVGVRMSRPADVLQCWMHDSTAQWVLTVPVCLSLVASAVFLVNVVRVLLTKLHTHSANPTPVGMRKAVRAAAILVPLFGLQHVLLPFRPAPHEPGERAYQLISAVLVSLQGLCVSCLFCFANVDVHGALRPLLCRLWGRQRAASMHTQSRDVCV